LEAGRAEFAAYGLAGGRTDRIAAASGVNKQRIYAHFGSKDGLFEAVVDFALTDLLDVVPLPGAGPGAPKSVEEYVGRVAAYHRERPELMRLVQWESLETAGEVDLTCRRGERYREKVVHLAETLGIPPERAGPLLMQLIMLAAGPQAVPRLTALVMGLQPGAALEALAASSAKAAAAVLRAGPAAESALGVA
jgi:AcrR family transcriptional regulator